MDHVKSVAEKAASWDLWAELPKLLLYEDLLILQKEFAQKMGRIWAFSFYQLLVFFVTIISPLYFGFPFPHSYLNFSFVGKCFPGR